MKNIINPDNKLKILIKKYECYKSDFYLLKIKFMNTFT